MKWFFGLLSKLWRWLSPVAQQALTAQIAQVAEDIIRRWIANHVGQNWLPFADLLISELMRVLGISRETAERAIYAAAQKVTAANQYTVNLPGAPAPGGIIKPQ
jgi:hypothetical protein